MESIKSHLHNEHSLKITLYEIRETLLATKANKAKGIQIEDIAEQADWIGDQHIATSVETPIRKTHSSCPQRKRSIESKRK